MQVEKKGNGLKVTTSLLCFETKAKTLCLHAATWAWSLITPRCSRLGGVKSEGSCPLLPWAVLSCTGLRPQRHDRTVTQDQMLHLFMLLEIQRMGLICFTQKTCCRGLCSSMNLVKCVCSVCVCVACEHAEGKSLSDWYSTTALAPGVLWKRVIKHLLVYDPFFTDKKLGLCQLVSQRHRCSRGLTNSETLPQICWWFIQYLLLSHLFQWCINFYLTLIDKRAHFVFMCCHF